MSASPPQEELGAAYAMEPYEFAAPQAVPREEVTASTAPINEAPTTVSQESPPEKKPAPSVRSRKAPNAPKRFKSSYICFFMAKQTVIKEELGDAATVTTVSRKSAEMWRALSQADRAHWDGVAEKDRLRFNMEKANYKGPWKVPWKRQRKDPSAPKRPMSAFLNFSQHKRAEIKAKHPEMKNTDISRMLGEMWRQLPEEERSPHVEREKQERSKYKVAMDAWRKEQEAKEVAHRKAQTEQAAEAHAQLLSDPFLIGQSPAVVSSYLIQQSQQQQSRAPHRDSSATARQTPSGPPPSLPTTGTPIVLGPNGLPLASSLQQLSTPPAFDESQDFEFPAGEEEKLFE